MNKRTKDLVVKLAQPEVRQAIVHAVEIDTIDVRPIQSPTVIRNVRVVGDIGQLRRGDVVTLVWDRASRRPVAMLSTALPDADVVEESVALSTSRNVILLVGPDIEQTYEITPAGLASAISNSFDGCVIFIPRGSIVYSFTLPQGVHLVGAGMRATTIYGEVTGGAGIHNLTIHHTDDGAVGYHYDGGNTILHNVEIEVFGAQCAGVMICGSGTLDIVDCLISSEYKGIYYIYGTLNVIVYGGAILAEDIYDSLPAS